MGNIKVGAACILQLNMFSCIPADDKSPGHEHNSHLLGDMGADVYTSKIPKQGFKNTVM